MADIKVSTLNTAATILSTTILYAVSAGPTSEKITVGQLLGGGGANQRILFNDNGVVGNVSNLLFDKTNNIITLDGGTNANTNLAVINNNAADSELITALNSGGTASIKARTGVATKSGKLTLGAPSRSSVLAQYGASATDTLAGQGLAGDLAVLSAGNVHISTTNDATKTIRFITHSGTAYQLVGSFSGGTLATGSFSIKYTTPATSPSAAAIVVDGGLGVAGSAYFGGTVFSDFVTARTASTALTLTPNGAVYPGVIVAISSGGAPTGDANYLTIQEGASPGSGNNRGILINCQAKDGNALYTLGSFGFRTGATWATGGASNRDGVFVVRTRVDDSLADRMLIDGVGDTFFNGTFSVGGTLGTLVSVSGSPASDGASLRVQNSDGGNQHVAAVFGRGLRTANGGTMRGVLGFCTNTGGDGLCIGVEGYAEFTTGGATGSSSAVGGRFTATSAATQAGKTAYGNLTAVTATGASNAANVRGYDVIATAAASSAEAFGGIIAVTAPGAFTGGTIRGLVVSAVMSSGTASTTASAVGGFDLSLTVNQGSSLGYDLINANVTETATGTGTKRLLNLARGGNSQFQIFRDGTTVVGAGAALATNATDGFLYIPTCAGTPTGTPTTQTAKVPLVVDTSNNKLYFYSGGAWRDAGP